MNPQNPKLSPDGRSVVSGFGDLWLDGAPLLVPVFEDGRKVGETGLRGQHPGWLSNAWIGFLDPTGYLCEYRGPDIEPRRLFGVPFNVVSLGGNQWIGTNTAQQKTYTSLGAVIPDSYCPAMSPDGFRWACLTGNTSESHGLLVNGVEVARGPFDDREGMSLGPTVVALSMFVDGLPQTFIYTNTLEPAKATWDRYEVGPGVATLPSADVWIVSHDDTRTLVRPARSTFGYVLPGCKTPHVAWDPSTASLRVVGDLENRLLDYRLDLNAPRIDLSQRPDIEPPPPPPPPPPPDFAITMLPMSASGVTPLSFDATASVTSGGPAVEWTWQYRRTGQVLVPWREAGVSQEPRLRFTIDLVGEYEFRVLATNAFGDLATTSRQRLATVLPKEPLLMPGKPYDEQFYLKTVAVDAAADYAAVNRALDAQYPIWFTRTETDYQNAGLSLVQSWLKHRNEMREKLDPAGTVLPQIPGATPNPQ